MNGVSVAMDETTREVSERQVMPAGGLRERIEQSRPITAYGEGTPFERGMRTETMSDPATTGAGPSIAAMIERYDNLPLGGATEATARFA